MVLDAICEYGKEVREGAFPGPEHSFKMSDEALAHLEQMIWK
jgi:ketopantoate hydroxymethyltransferase